MNVNGMPDLSSAKQTGPSKPSKWNSKTSDNSLFQSILGQQSQGRDNKAAAVQQKGKLVDKSASAPSAKSEKPSDAIADKDTTTISNESSETTEAVTDSNQTQSSDEAPKAENVTESGDESVEAPDTVDDVSSDMEQVSVAAMPVPIIIIPGPIVITEAVEIKGTMEMVAPPVIQTAEQNVQPVISEPLMTETAETADQPALVVSAETMGDAAAEIPAEFIAQTEPEAEITQPQAAQQVNTADADTKAQAQPAATQETGDAAEHFAAQVVKEARELVNKGEEQTMAPVAEEEIAGAPTDTTARPVEETAQPAVMQEDAEPETEDPTKADEQQKHPAATQPQTASADSGRIEFRMNSAQPLEAQQVAAPPEPPQAIMNRVIDQVRSAVTPDKTEFFVQLKPDYLGGLSIGLVAEDKGVVAKIMTSSQQVHNALQADMNQMVQMLRDKGINVVQMEVIYDQTANAMSQQSDAQQQQQFGQSRGHSQGRGTDQTDGSVSMYDVLSSNEVLAEQGGSVEFSA